MTKGILKILAITIPFFGVASANCTLEFSSDHFYLQDSIGNIYESVDGTSDLFGKEHVVLSTGSCSDDTNKHISTAKNTLQYIEQLKDWDTNRESLPEREEKIMMKKIQNQVETLFTERMTQLLIANNYTGDVEDDIMYDMLESDPLGQKVIGLVRALSFYEDNVADTFAMIQEDNLPETTIEREANSLSEDQLTLQRNNKYFLGDRNALISLIEYSDIGCYACINHYENNTVNDLLQALSGAMSYVYKPVDIGYYGEYQAQAVMCAGKLGGESAYNNMREYTYLNSYVIEGSHDVSLVDSGMISSYAVELGIYKGAFEDCINNGDVIGEYIANKLEAKSFDMTGTPATVVINNGTRKRVLLQGSYLTGDFLDAIKSVSE